jgi:hypothetical protein
MIAARLAAAALGVWLMAAPGVVETPVAQSTSLHVVGPITAALSVAAASPVADALRWLLFPPAGWLILAPWLLGAGTTAVTVNSVIVGVLMAALAAVGPRHHARRGGGWRAVAPLLRHSPGGGGDGHV